MIRHETVISILRFYPKDTDDPLAKYDASCTLVWESSDTVWIKALSGTFTRQYLRELIRFLYDKNIKLLKSYRSSGTLPYATKVEGNYCEIDLDIVKPKVEKFLS